MKDQPNIIAVILAAGRGTRFGATKQLASFGGEAMVARVSNAVRSAEPGAVVLVAGHDAGSVHDAADVPFIVINERYRDGLGTSIARASATLRHAADALLFCLGDQPLIPAAHYRDMIDAWDGEADSVVATQYGGEDTAGAPVLFGRAWFDRLAGLTGDQGAKVLLRDAGEFVTVACDEAAFDIDTPADLSDAPGARAHGSRSARSSPSPSRR